MLNRDRKHVWQCQILIDDVWVDRLKKPYPRKSAFAEKEWCFHNLGTPLDALRVIDIETETNQTRVNK